MLVFPQRINDGLTTDEIITQNLYDNWYFKQSTWSIKDFPNGENRFSGEDYAWGWSYAANSLIDMYKATGQKKYLEYFIPQAEYILNHTDQKLGIESFTNSGLFLPAWSDRGHYTSGKFTYTYPVHTGMITLPMLRFVDAVKENNLSEYMAYADKFLQESGKALAVHNTLWRDLSETQGFYEGHSYGTGYVSEANKIGIPNRVFGYLAACGLYDKLSGSNIYTERIKKSLNYFKRSILRYDSKYDSYYWSYWVSGGTSKSWEDISHAALTVYGLYILHQEAGFDVLNKQDFLRFKNIVYKLVNQRNPPDVRLHIHQRNKHNKIYYTSNENPYYYSALRFAFLIRYDKNLVKRLEGVYQEFYLRENPSSVGLFIISTYLNTKQFPSR
jgi:hypothetical protein